MQIIDKVGWIYIKDRKVLGARSFNKDAFYIPGGKREGNESDLEVLKRELNEELSIDFDINSAEFLGTWSAQAHGKPEGVIVVLKCYTGGYSGTIKVANEIEELKWLDSQDIFTDLTSPTDKIILANLKQKNLID